jgi:hypothetical protein
MSLLLQCLPIYGVVSEDAIETNYAMLTAAWDIKESIKAAWSHIREVADAGRDIANETAIHLTLVVFQKTCLFSTAISYWHNKLSTDWTLETFQKHFNREKDECKHLMTLQIAGYDSANAAVSLPVAPSATPIAAP